MAKKRSGAKKSSKRQPGMRPVAPQLVWKTDALAAGQGAASLPEAPLVEREKFDSLAPVSASFEAVAEVRSDDAAAPVREGGAATDREVPDAPPVDAAEEPRELRLTDPATDVASAMGVAAPTGAGGGGAVSTGNQDDDATMRAFFEAAEERLLRAEEDARAHSLDLALEKTLDAPPPPHVIARRTKLRKLVSGLLGMASVLALAVGVKAISGRNLGGMALGAMSQPGQNDLPLPSHGAQPEQPARPVEAAQAARPAPPVQETARPAEAAPAEQAAAAPPPAPDQPTGAATEATQDAPPAAAPVAEPAAAPADPAQAKALARKSLALLERGNNKGAIEAATAAVEADPTDADPYLYWGTALMELGKRADAKQVFGRCVDQATRGRKAECRQFR
jgi:hypothetical protein